MVEQQFDVAIVGYGPTGVTAANLLGAAGLRVVVLERDADVFTRARAISTDEEVMRIWQGVGLAERLKQDVLAGLPLEFVDAHGGTLIDARVTDHGSGHPPQMFIYQPALEQVLREGVERYPNVEVRLGHDCLRVREDDAGVEITAVDTGTERLVRVRASYVIAADGGSSPIRAQLNVGYEGRTYEDRWVVVDTKMLQQWPHHDRLRFHCDPARPAVDCPTPLGHHRWEFPILPGEDEAELVTDSAIWQMLARYGVDDRNVEILRAVVYSHHVRIAARWRVGRVFLAGDAAHAMPPWIGQGMAAGVRDAANLCWKLAAVVNGELPEAVLDSYQTERLPHLREVTRRAVFVGRLITERRRAVTAVRNPALRLITKLPFVNDYLQRSSWIPRPHYPEGFLAGGISTATGHRLPQPEVVDGTGARVRLDDAVGGGWVVLHLPGVVPPRAWVDAGVGTVTIARAGGGVGATAGAAGVITDPDATLTNWLRDHGADTVVLRPDGFVYAAGRGGAVPHPPTGFTLAA